MSKYNDFIDQVLDKVSKRDNLIDELRTHQNGIEVVNIDDDNIEEGIININKRMSSMVSNMNMLEEISIDILKDLRNNVDLITNFNHLKDSLAKEEYEKCASYRKNIISILEENKIFS